MLKTKPLLITVPTFERYEFLMRTIADLSRFDASLFDLFIFDNASPDYRYKSLLENELCKIFPNLNYKITHNPSNLGISGNIIKCLESSKGYEWVWLLSDDDSINDDFQLEELIQLLEHLNQNVAYVGLSGVSNAAINGEATFYNVGDFLKNVPFPGILLISTLVFRVTNVMERLSVGVSAANTLCPHVAIVLNGISPLHGFYASKIEPIQWNPSDHRWETDTSLSGRADWSLEVSMLIDAFSIGLTKKETSLLYQVLASNYVRIDNIINECYHRYSDSFASRIRFIAIYALAVISYDPRIASKIGGLLSIFLCHSSASVRLFCWLRIRAKKIFPQKRKRKNLNY